MAFVPQNFIDKSLPVVSASWLNNVDNLVNNVFGGVTTIAQAAALILAAPLNLTGPVTIAVPVSGGVALTAQTSLVSNVGIRVTGAYNSSVQLNVSNTGSGISSGAVLDLQDTSTTGTVSYSTSTATAVGTNLIGGVNGNALTLNTNSAVPIQFATNFVVAMSIGGSGAVVINKSLAVNGGQTVTGLANTFASTITGFATSGQSFGLLIQAGTTSSDLALRINNSASIVFQVDGAGSVNVGAAPTGGGQGIGTINAASGYFVNGVKLPIPTISPPFLSGFGTPTGATTTTNFPGSTATLVQCSSMIANIIQLMKTAGWVTA
jgi:hypothetical protein